jgi:hypothetical protein
MLSKEQLTNKMVRLIDKFESRKHDLQELPAADFPPTIFADVILLNLDAPYEDTSGGWSPKRPVRTELPHVYDWLFRRFVRILAQLPDYGMHKEEIFGRLGNTITMTEAELPALSPEQKVAAVLADFWEISQDLFEGKIQSFAVALGAEVVDDYVTRSLKSGFINQQDFEKAIFGAAS